VEEIAAISAPPSNTISIINNDAIVPVISIINILLASAPSKFGNLRRAKNIARIPVVNKTPPEDDCVPVDPIAGVTKGATRSSIRNKRHVVIVLHIVTQDASGISSGKAKIMKIKQALLTHHTMQIVITVDVILCQIDMEIAVPGEGELHISSQSSSKQRSKNDKLHRDSI